MKRLLLVPLVALVLGACDDSRTATGPAEDNPVASMNAAAATYDCSPPAQWHIPQAECEALVALYNSTNGSTDWTNRENWLVTGPWYWVGVRVEDGHVEQLIIYENNLTGSIPPELGNLSKLKDLHLQDNQLSGAIPAELGNLTELETLQLYLNQLTGQIPAALGGLSNLQSLNLFSNQLSGPIPAELGNLSNLSSLDLRVNQLSGPIPAELGNLGNLASLWAYQNQLSGPIPPELGNLSKLKYLVLDTNQLSGPIPAELGNLSSLEFLLLHYNQLSGLVPIDVAALGGSVPCAFVPGNPGLYMPDTQPYLDADQDNDGYICGLALSDIVPVAIDVKPGSDPNCVNEDSRGRIPVAILSESGIDLTDVDVSTVQIDDDTDPSTAGVSWVRWSLNKDVSGDLVPDLVLHFSTVGMKDAGLLVDWNTLHITGGLFDGTAILGSDVINLAGGDYCFD